MDSGTMGFPMGNPTGQSKGQNGENVSLVGWKVLQMSRMEGGFHVQLKRVRKA